MKILVACEESGAVRDAFAEMGHDVISCDLLPSRTPGNHYQGDVFDIINDGFDMMVAFPPCTDLCVSGARWFESKKKTGKQQKSVEFFLKICAANIPKKCVENPVGIMSKIYRKPNQIIQPWQFGHGETKATCLWLENLPPLVPTKIVSGRVNRIWLMQPGPERAKERSKTYFGIAAAMAHQWGREIIMPENAFSNYTQAQLNYLGGCISPLPCQ